tara:strand:+ start:64 stop:552 length:489 start_codon:yes stop_codon:yes gene_type:complete
MQYKKYIKQRTASIQGLRSLNDTLPKNIKNFINKKGHIYSVTLNNWKYIVGDKLFKVCYPKSFKSKNNFNVGTLLIMVQRGHEVNLEYSKKEIMDRMNSLFKDDVVKKLRITSFNNKTKMNTEKSIQNNSVTNFLYKDKLDNVKNEKIKNSLVELIKAFKKK